MHRCQSNCDSRMPWPIKQRCYFFYGGCFGKTFCCFLTSVRAAPPLPVCTRFWGTIKMTDALIHNYTGESEAEQNLATVISLFCSHCHETWRLRSTKGPEDISHFQGDDMQATWIVLFIKVTRPIAVHLFLFNYVFALDLSLVL